MRMTSLPIFISSVNFLIRYNPGSLKILQHTRQQNGIWLYIFNQTVINRLKKTQIAGDPEYEFFPATTKCACSTTFHRICSGDSLRTFSIFKIAASQGTTKIQYF